MTKRYNYVIGDVQGCFEALKTLLKTIKFDPDQDFLWFAGDLVARGENSVGTLRFVKKLADRGAAATVLGNHDLTLIACARGFKKIKDKDRTQDILDAIDGDELIDWLRKQPLSVFPNEQTMITHAGVPCIWTAEKTAANHRFPFSHKVLALRKGPIVHRRPPALLTLSCYLATRLLRATSSC